MRIILLDYFLRELIKWELVNGAAEELVKVAVW
jgi:hypothetical protein